MYYTRTMRYGELMARCKYLETQVEQLCRENGHLELQAMHWQRWAKRHRLKDLATGAAAGFVATAVPFVLTAMAWAH